MKIKCRLTKILLAVTFIPFLMIGCIEPIKLIQMEAGKGNSYQEFSFKNYKGHIKILLLTEEDYVCSFKLVDKYEGIPVRNLKATLGVKKYPTLAMRRDKHHHDKQKIMSGIEPIVDTLSNDFDYKYKIKSKGRYEITIKITEIEGKELDKDIQVSFDQEIK
jgi:hypothetical protein